MMPETMSLCLTIPDYAPSGTGRNECCRLANRLVNQPTSDADRRSGMLPKRFITAPRERC